MPLNQASQEPFAETVQSWDLQRLYRDLAAAKPSSMRPGLTDVEKQHLCGLLCGYSPAEIAKKLSKTAKSVEVDLSKTIYRYVETLTGRTPNALDNWRTIAVWLEAKGYKIQPDSAGILQASTVDSTANPRVLDWGEAPDVSILFGRDTELATLTQWLAADRCRLVAVLGIWGIGKTTLAARLADQVKTEFECLIWRSFLSPVPLESVLKDWLQQLSPYTAIEVPNDVDGQIACLMQTLHRHRCLLILDGLETILDGDFAGHYHTEYRGYGNLLQRVGQARHQSCLLLTSREKPSEVDVSASNPLVRSLQLNGLSKESAQEMLRTKGLAREDRWHKLVEIYRGNPLVLNIVSTSIQDLFGGDVDAFLQQSPTYVTRDLSRFLQQQLARLSPVEQQILYKLAQLQEPMTLVELQESLRSTSPYDVFEALEGLIKRSLVERSTGQGFSLQPVIAEYLRRNNSQ